MLWGGHGRSGDSLLSSKPEHLGRKPGRFSNCWNNCKFGAESTPSPCCVAWEPCLLFAAETTSSRGSSSGRLWNLGSGPIHLLVGGRRWWKTCLGKTQMGLWTSNLVLNPWWPKGVDLRVWSWNWQPRQQPRNLWEMNIRTWGLTVDQLNQKLWMWGPALCVLRSLPGGLGTSKFENSLPKMLRGHEEDCLPKRIRLWWLRIHLLHSWRKGKTR